MTIISSKVTIDEAEIKIKHESCSDPSWCRNKEIYIEANGKDNDTLSTITVNDYLTVYVYWESFSYPKSFEVLYVPSTGVLFLGASTISAQINTKKSKLIGIEFPCLFWALERHENFVIEYGELECFLYDLEGKKISSADVDPPYEIEFTEQGIQFESTLVGKTWLRYDRND